MTHLHQNPKPYNQGATVGFLTQPFLRSQSFLHDELNFADAVSLELHLNHIVPHLAVDEINGIYSAFESVMSDVIQTRTDEEVEALKEYIDELLTDHRDEMNALRIELENKLARAYSIAGKFAIELLSHKILIMTPAADNNMHKKRRQVRRPRGLANKILNRRRYFARWLSYVRRLARF